MILNLFEDEVREGPFHILTVCTGNICRSPLAEVMLRKSLQGTPTIVKSAGTHAHVGDPMTEPNQQIAADHGIVDGLDHVASQLTSEDLEWADLILALSREHRREIAELLPRAIRKTYTLREFGRLARNVSETVQTDELPDAGARLRSLVNAMGQLRGTIPPLEEPADDDVVDPYRQSGEVYAESANQIVPAVNATATIIRRVLGRGGAEAR